MWRKLVFGWCLFLTVTFAAVGYFKHVPEFALAVAFFLCCALYNYDLLQRER